ncbi:MAG TPA: glycosyltransferase [Burkholderiales bacterium]|nr:glycosyltransferase [Burkholderiales bacterium]
MTDEAGGGSVFERPSAPSPHSRSSALVRLVTFLIGVGAHREPDVHDALHAPGVLRILIALVGFRLIRVLTQRVTRYPTATMHAPEPKPQVESSLRSRDAFPRIIFQTWKSRTDMPRHFARWSETLRRAHPRWTHLLWDDADNRRFIETHYPWFLDDYDSYPQEIYRADAVRYFFLYHHGGLYADMDTQCIDATDALFENGDVFLARMGRDALFPHSIPNAIMASRRHQEFWLLVIALLIDNAQAMRAGTLNAGPATVTGPILLKKACDLYADAGSRQTRTMVNSIARRLPSELKPEDRPSRLVMLSQPDWYPLDWTNLVHLRFAREAVHVPLAKPVARWLFPGCHLVTYWTHSW